MLQGDDWHRCGVLDLLRHDVQFVEGPAGRRPRGSVQDGADWIDVLLGSSRYKICVNTAKAANRTHVQNALIEASMM